MGNDGFGELLKSEVFGRLLVSASKTAVTRGCYEACGSVMAFQNQFSAEQLIPLHVGGTVTPMLARQKSSMAKEFLYSK
jgi:hypothetical protein